MALPSALCSKQVDETEAVISAAAAGNALLCVLQTLLNGTLANSFGSVKMNGWTALHEAAKTGNAEIVKVRASTRIP